MCSLGACHMWLTRNHMFICVIWGKFTSFIFRNFENFLQFTQISKFQKSELGKFIPNFPLKHVITSTNHKSWSCRTGSHKKYSKTWKYSQNGSSWQQNITQDRKSFITNSNLYFDFYILLTKAFTMLGFNVFYYAGFFF